MQKERERHKGKVLSLSCFVNRRCAAARLIESGRVHRRQRKYDGHPSQELTLINSARPADIIISQL